MFYFNYIGTLLLSSWPLFLLVSVIWLIHNHITIDKKELIKKITRKGNLHAMKAICVLIILFILTLFILITIIPYWMDFPKFITGNYDTKEGIIANEKYSRVKDSHTNITIENNIYIFYDSEYPTIGNKVSIKYLPNTKLIYKIVTK